MIYAGLGEGVAFHISMRVDLDFPDRLYSETQNYCITSSMNKLDEAVIIRLIYLESRVTTGILSKWENFVAAMQCKRLVVNGSQQPAKSVTKISISSRDVSA